MNKSFNIALDVENELYSPGFIHFTVSRNDFETVDLFFTITQDKAPFNLTGTTIELGIKKPSGLTVYQQCEINDPVTGTASTRLSIQGYVEYGVHTAELYIRSGTQMVVSCPFYYHSRSSVMETTEIESVNDWSALQQALFAYDLKPVLVEGFPAVVPEYVGQLAFDIYNKRTYIATDLTAASWALIGAGEGGAGGDDTILGEGSPPGFPARIGQIYIDIAAPAAYIATGSTAADWEQIDNTGAGAVSWDSLEGKPEVFPADLTEPGLAGALAAKADDSDLAGKANIAHTHTTANITDFAAGVAANIPAEYLTQAEGDGRYLTGIPAEYLTEAEGDLRYKAAGAPVEDHVHTVAEITDFAAGVAANIPAAYLTETEGNAAYAAKIHTHTAAAITDFAAAVAGAIPAEYVTQAEADLRYELKGAGGEPVAAAWGTITGILADQTDLQTALNGKAQTIHSHVIGDVTGLQGALDNKADDVELEAYAQWDFVYTKDQVYNKTEIDQMTMGDGGGSPVIVEDNLASTSTTNALSANQGRILNSTKASLNHNHTIANITDFAAGVAANIPAEYLTETEGDGRYLTALPAEVLTETEAAGLYSPLGHSHTTANITDFAAGVAASIPAEYLTATEGNNTYQPLGDYAPVDHVHTVANITDFAAGVAANIPTEYLTATEGNAAYQPKGTYLTAVPAEYLTETEGNALYAKTTNVYSKTAVDSLVTPKADKTYVDNADNVIISDILNGKKIWAGTQADYDLITTPDPATLYFITG